MTAFRGLAPNSLELYSSGFRRLRYPTGVGHFIPISVEKWVAISEDSCRKTKQARPHSLIYLGQLGRGGWRFVCGKCKK